ncbi:MAG: hypothetical protein AAGI01_10045 [Myxococcota bacterium]
MSDAPKPLAYCTRCDEEVTHDAYGIDLSGFCVCASCRAEAKPASTPWEDASAPSATEAFVQTTLRALARPREFFHSLEPSARWLPAVVLGGMWFSAGSVVRRAWLIAADADSYLSYTKAFTEFTGASGVPAPSVSQMRLFLLAQGPMMMPLALAATVVVLHSALRIARVPSDIRVVARIVGYSFAAFAFLAVPDIWGFPVGQFLALFWMFTLQNHGVQRFHDIQPLRSLLVVSAALMMVLLLRCY